MRPESRWRAMGRFARRVPLSPVALSLTPVVILSLDRLGGWAALAAAAVLPLVVVVALQFRRGESGQFRRDSTTQLPLRATLVDKIARDLRSAPSSANVACIAVSVELPTVSDRQGDRLASALMRRVADRLRADIRGHDCLVRLDGPRFAIGLAPDARIDIEAALQMAIRLLSVLDDPIRIGGTEMRAAPCIGFCLRDALPSPDAETLITAAESALTAARRGGAGAIRAWSVEIGAPVTQQGDLAREIAQALDDRRIAPWFQPQISTHDGRLTGVEALARWDHPVDGILPPDRFLPTIEATGLTHRLTGAILDRALGALAGWDAAGIEVPRVSVNLSARDLSDPGIADRIAEMLDRHGLSPSRLGVEVLETVLARRADDAIVGGLRRLHHMGCLIELDDFGTGHASITNLRRFPVCRIKIDRSFVTGIGDDRALQDMVAAILTMAEQLSLDTLAEGVETGGDHAMLAQLGCGHVQGYGIARPMPPEALPDWLAAHAANLPQPAIAARGWTTDSRAGARDRSTPSARGGKTA